MVYISHHFIQFIKNQTNCTMLRHPTAEADDMIARWIDLHPQDQHIIISSDSDFQQLIADNVKIYNGIAGLLYTTEGIYDKDGNLTRIDFLDQNGDFVIQALWDPSDEQTSENRIKFREWTYKMLKQQDLEVLV